jgi:hypothetical protein
LLLGIESLATRKWEVRFKEIFFSLQESGRLLYGNLIFVIGIRSFAIRDRVTCREQMGGLLIGIGALAVRKFAGRGRDRVNRSISGGKFGGNL